MKSRLVQLKDQGETPFVLKKNERYTIKPFGYIDQNDPLRNTIYDPLDIERVTITKIGELPDGSEVFTASNNCNCGVNINIYELDQ